MWRTNWRSSPISRANSTPLALCAAPRVDSQRVRAIFDAVARRYDLLNTLCSLGLHKAWRRAALRFCPPAARALDLCTGTGDWALGLASRCGMVAAVDFSGRMLSAAAIKTRRARRVCLVTGDVMRSPFRDSSFDLATIGFSLRNMPSLAQFFREAARVLRPDGRLVSLELTSPSRQPWRALHRWYLLLVVPMLGALAQRTAYCYLARSILDFASPDEVASLMRQAGFSRVRYLPLTGGIATLHVGLIDH